MDRQHDYILVPKKTFNLTLLNKEVKKEGDNRR